MINSSKVVINLKWPTGSTHESLQRKEPSIAKSIALPDTQRRSIQAEVSEKEVMARKQHSQYLKLCSSSNGTTGIACATFRPEFQKNYISPRIVQRLKLHSYTECTASTSPVVGAGLTITPTLEYVYLLAPTKSNTEQRRYQFYVVKHCPVRFDILFGSESIPLL